MKETIRQARQRRSSDICPIFVALGVVLCLLASMGTAFTIHSPIGVSSSPVRLHYGRYTNKVTLKRWMADDENDDNDNVAGEDESSAASSRRRRMRKRVADLARMIVLAPIKTASSISPMPQAVASVLKDATLNAVDLAVEEGEYTHTHTTKWALARTLLAYTYWCLSFDDSACVSE